HRPAAPHRMFRPARSRVEPRQAVALKPLPPARQYLPRDLEFTAQIAQRSTTGMQAHQERSNFRTVRDTSWHEPPPCGPSYELSLMALPKTTSNYSDHVTPTY